MYGNLELFDDFDETKQITKNKLNHKKRFKYLCVAMKGILYDYIQDVMISYRMISYHIICVTCQ